MTSPAPGRERDPGPADFHATWVAELDRLEVDITLAEALLCANEPALPMTLLPAWRPPALRGPLPSDLEPRARLVLERQLAVASLVTERLTQVSRHRRLTQRVRDTGQPDIPVYIDLSA